MARVSDGCVCPAASLRYSFDVAVRDRCKVSNNSSREQRGRRNASFSHPCCHKIQGGVSMPSQGGRHMARSLINALAVYGSVCRPAKRQLRSAAT